MREFALEIDTTALVIVDMQNDFVRVGAPMEVADARATIATHQQLLEVWRQHQARLFTPNSSPDPDGR